MDDVGTSTSNGPAPPAPTPWPRIEPASAAEIQRSDLKLGLARADAASRIAEFGEKVLEQRGGRSPRRLLLDPFASTLVLVLLGAAVVSATVGSTKDAMAILAIVLLNAALGFMQEFRVERAGRVPVGDTARLQRVPEAGQRRQGQRDRESTMSATALGFALAWFFVGRQALAGVEADVQGGADNDELYSFAWFQDIVVELGMSL